jgi:hypothetical protein
MPEETRPNIKNMLIRTFNLYYDPGTGERNLGVLEVGKFNCNLESYDFKRNKTGKAFQRLQFLDPPHVEANLKEFNWMLVAEQLGLTIEDINAGTDDLPNNIGWTIYDDKFTSICGGGYRNVSLVVLDDESGGAGVTPFAEWTDFVVDPVNGTVIAVPSGQGGGITSGSTIYIKSGKYAIQDAKRIKLTTDRVVNQGVIRLVHPCVDGKDFIVKMWAANFMAGLEIPFAHEPQEIPIVIDGLDDGDNHSDSPFGYVEFET